MGAEREGLATVVALLGGAGAADPQGGLFDGDEDAVAAGPLQPAKRKGGRPAGARNRSTEQWRQHFLARFQSPLMGLGEIAARPVAELAAELRLYRKGTVPVTGPDGEIKWVEREDPEQLDLERAFKLQLEAMQAALPYVHQKQPLAVETRGEGRAVLVFGDLAVAMGGETGDAIPFARHEQNQRVIDGEVAKSVDEKSYGGTIASGNNGLGREND